MSTAEPTPSIEPWPEKTAASRLPLSTRATLVAVGVVAAIFLVTLVVTLLIWHTPAIPAIDVPLQPSA